MAMQYNFNHIQPFIACIPQTSAFTSDILPSSTADGHGPGQLPRGIPQRAQLHHGRHTQATREGGWEVVEGGARRTGGAYPAEPSQPTREPTHVSQIFTLTHSRWLDFVITHIPHRPQSPVLVYSELLKALQRMNRPCSHWHVIIFWYFFPWGVGWRSDLGKYEQFCHAFGKV